MDRFERNSAFPCMANVIELTENPTFGKHLISKRDIDVGRIVMATEAFASIQYLECAASGCFHCGKETSTKIQCQHCINVHFCSEACSLNEIHRTICNPLFSHTDSEEVRFATEIIRTALSRFPDTKTFLDFCRSVLFGKMNQPPQNQPPYSQYGEILRLKEKSEPDHLSMARRAAQCIRLSQVDLDHDDFERILIHLSYRHITSLAQNSFTEETTVSRGGISTRFSLYDILSRFNHSCSPNLHHYIDENQITCCVVIRPIKKGDQVFINYLGEMKLSGTDRQKYIKEKWDFECQCAKCENNC